MSNVPVFLDAIQGIGFCLAHHDPSCSRQLGITKNKVGRFD